MKTRWIGLIVGLLCLAIAGCGSSTQEVEGDWVVDVHATVAAYPESKVATEYREATPNQRQTMLLMASGGHYMIVRGNGLVIMSEPIDKKNFEGTWTLKGSEFVVASKSGADQLQFTFRDGKFHGPGQAEARLVLARMGTLDIPPIPVREPIPVRKPIPVKEPALAKANNPPAPAAEKPRSTRREKAAAPQAAPVKPGPMPGVESAPPAVEPPPMLEHPEVARSRSSKGENVSFVTVSKDGKRALALGTSTVSGFHHTAFLLDGRTLELLKQFKLPETEHRVYFGAALSPDGKRAIVWDIGGQFALWDTDDEREIVLLPHGERITNAAFSPDGTRLATGGSKRECVIRIWDAVNGKLVSESDKSDKGFAGLLGVTGLQFCDDQERLFSSTAVEILTLDAQSGRLISRLDISRTTGFLTAFTFDGKYAANVGPNHAALWDMRQGKLLQQIKIKNAPAGRAHLSSDGSWLAVGEGDKHVALWNFKKAVSHASFLSNPHGGIAVAADEQVLLSCDSNAIHAWQLPESPDEAPPSTGAAALETKVGEIRRLQVPAEQSGLDAPCFFPDNRRAIVAGFGEDLNVFDLSDGKSLAQTG